MENLRRIRKAKGLTMKQLAEMTDVSESMIQMVETGSRSPGFELLLKLGETLDVSVDELLGIKKERAVDYDTPDDNFNLDLSHTTPKQRELIKQILEFSDEQAAAFLLITQHHSANQ